MILFCEECGAKNSFEPDEIKDGPYYIHCQVCDDVIKVDTQLFSKPRLRLSFVDQIIELGNDRPVVTIGRKSHNDLVINDEHVSRFHVAIMYLEKKFMLIDLSNNGTYIKIHEKEGITVKGDRFELSGHGIIGVGREAEPDSPWAVSFAIP